VGTAHGHAMVTCSVCGASQPLVSAYEKPEARAAWEAALAFAPRPLVGLLVRYLDMFSAPGRAPQERTVARVLTDLAERIGTGQVDRGGVTYAAPLDAWEVALRLLVTGQTEVSLPLRNNNYLAGIVWRRADSAAGRAEKAKEAEAASGTGRVSDGGPRAVGAIAPAPRAAREPAGPGDLAAGVKAIRAVLAGLAGRPKHTGDDDGSE
jgi:hypothetical protein